MNPSPTFIYYTKWGIDSLSGLACHLNETDKKSFSTFTNLKRQQVFVTGRALLSIALKQHSKATSYELYYNENGKPYLNHPKHWYFNLTHSGQHIYLALRKEHLIGIDCEVIRQRSYKNIAASLFSKAEQMEIQNSHCPMSAFLLLWTRYEAKIKYSGTSIFSATTELRNIRLSSFKHQKQIISVCTDNGSEPLFEWYDCDLAKKQIMPTSNHQIQAFD